VGGRPRQTVASGAGAAEAGQLMASSTHPRSGRDARGCAATPPRHRRSRRL
jgi:hypothetical protein